MDNEKVFDLYVKNYRYVLNSNIEKKIVPIDDSILSSCAALLTLLEIKENKEDTK